MVLISVFQVVPSNGGGLVLGNNVQYTTGQPEYTDLNQVLAADYGQSYSPYSADSQSSYDNNLQQQSPDPQGLANMNIASPIGIQSPDPTIGESLTIPLNHSTDMLPSLIRLHHKPLRAKRAGRGVMSTAAGLRLAMAALARQASRLGITLAITPVKGNIIILPKFKIVPRQL